MKGFRKQLRILLGHHELYFGILFVCVLCVFIQTSSVSRLHESTSSATSITETVPSSKSIKISESSSHRSLNTTINDDPNYVRQLHSCSTNFQQSLKLTTFNRTFILYELEWHNHHQINILFLLIENIQYPQGHIGNLTSDFSNIYLVQCLYKTKISKGKLHYLNVQEYDRTVIIHCENDQIDKTNNSQMTLLFTELSTGKVLQMNISLCWSIARRVTIGHCHKALFADIPFHIIQQWIDYHLSIGVEQFHMYDRTLKYKEMFQSYVDRGEVVYMPFPLSKQVVGREQFKWIDQFVAKMHCLMHIRSAFEWLGTWDIDEYLDFYSDQKKRTNIFI